MYERLTGRVHRRWVSGLSRWGALARDERGDVPGWVLVTVMTAGLVAGLWAIAGDTLNNLFTSAIEGTAGGP